MPEFLDWIDMNSTWIDILPFFCAGCAPKRYWLGAAGSSGVGTLYRQCLKSGKGLPLEQAGGMNHTNVPGQLFAMRRLERAAHQ